MTAPAVSVALAARDGAAHLPQAMDTLLAQTFGDFELIAVDDGSSDATWEILQGFAARDPRVIPLRNETNIGLAASLNRIIAMARAPLIARADGDDVYHPERFARQVAFMAANPKIGVLSCGFRRIDVAGRAFAVETPITGHDRIRFHMMFVNSMLHPGVMMRAAAVREAGGYDASLRVAEDTDLWLRLLPATRFENLVEPLVDYRVHAGQTTHDIGGPRWRASAARRRAALSAYLGRPLSEDEADAAFALFYAPTPCPPDLALAGETTMRAVRRAAARRETPALRLGFRLRIARALRRSAWATTGPRRRALLTASLRWAPTAKTACSLLADLLRRAPEAA